MDLEQRYQMMDDARDTPAYLSNGDRAYINGARLPFAHVNTLDGLLIFEYAWPTVARILATTRIFKVS